MKGPHCDFMSSHCLPIMAKAVLLSGVVQQSQGATGMLRHRAHESKSVVSLEQLVPRHSNSFAACLLTTHPILCL